MTANPLHQPALILDAEDALREVTRALGGAKSVGARLRPDLDPEAAGRWWHDCINSERAAKADLSQLIAVDEQAEAMRRFSASVAELSRLASLLQVGGR